MRLAHSIVAITLLTGAFASPARAADVHVGITVGVPPPPAFVFESPPPLVVVPGVPHVRYAPSASVNFFAYGDSYYTYDNGAWFIARHDHGPWAYVEPRYVPAAVLHVPTRYYRVAPRHVSHGRGHGHGHAKHGGHGYDRHRHGH